MLTPRRAAPLLLAGVAVALAASTPAAADPAPATPSPGAATVTKAGTSFLTATGVAAGQPVRVAASTGEYLYWSFVASAGETNQVAVTVTLPERHAPATWTVDVFDGLRRRQACTAGAQSPAVGTGDATVTLGCTLRQVRSWAEPWSGDPLPGTYYVRLAVVDLPEQDLGLPVQVDMLISATSDGDGGPEAGTLETPLVPPVRAGAVLTAQSADAAATADTDGTWLPDFSARWIWTTAGGVLAAVAGVVGFGLTRRPRRRP
ncbi:hypothetical protein SAMN05444365_11236 [Micromonospora pattaloongensis]|uniref:Peptidase n=1 Tax=Micromonospora pattaloongensis TaxID=405436 RepID=A0A1H3SJE6_9ACTN|nr:peptidase [Micromonospora pattaloongensis]SDZ38173.1 hypothetical protein SAMN05444365_11236 [Micromonospora pattaloongensis]